MLILMLCRSYGQQSFFSTVSYWVFTPYIYNPAMAGSKDFSTLGFNASFQGKANSQLLSFNSRISKITYGYFSTTDIKEFSDFGIGASVYNDFNGLARNTGISASGSYQIPLSARKLSFLSFGLSLKGEHHTINSDVNNILRKTDYFNIDAGVYLYGTNLFAGFSAINLRGSPWKPDTLGLYKVPISKQYVISAGYKFLISRSLNIILEPSVFVTATDSTFSKIGKNINPVLKLYLEDFCVGMSFLNDNKFSIFAQFRYPKFFVGAYYELAKKTPFYKNNPLVEVTLGLNLENKRSGISERSHW